MELYINKKVNDITYQSELILDIFDVKDLIRAYNLRRTFSASVSYALIKGGENEINKLFIISH